jgi:hypothetical protein
LDVEGDDDLVLARLEQAIEREEREREREIKRRWKEEERASSRKSSRRYRYSKFARSTGGAADSDRQCDENRPDGLGVQELTRRCAELESVLAAQDARYRRGLAELRGIISPSRYGGNLVERNQRDITLLRDVTLLRDDTLL